MFLSLLLNVGSFRRLFVNDLVCMGRYDARWILQNYVSTDLAVRAVRVKRDAFFHKRGTVLKSCDFVVKSFISQLGVE